MTTATIGTSTSEAPATLLERILAEGFHPGLPATMQDNALRVDIDVATELQCESCGQIGQAFLPMHSDGGGYRAVAICPRCGSQDEA